MTQPIRPTPALHLGSGEPLLLIQPFLLSPHVWTGVAERLADRFEVFAPALSGHWGGPPMPVRQASVADFADRIELMLDELGWDTCHIAGNSLGGWIGFELERRGRARTLTAIAPAGGWSRLSPAKFLVGMEFLSLLPLIGIGRLVPGWATRNRLLQRLVLPIAVHDSGAVSRSSAQAMLTAAIHCSAFLPVIGTNITSDGIADLAEVHTPTRLLLCEHDRIIPMRIYGRRFLDELPADADRIVMHGVGHVPMLEDPARIATLIAEHISGHARQLSAV
ncbi:alpha/beta fold hydrolase [Skermania piniformis]|uniref:Alpha/beta hydrolase n=1 Tax=Skermania pinensis TaxID=39122 RepID=A0ABX8S6A0_9ACTN|nr:alpha/beta hydrolase [Skermania piniformis]QXQ13373.1 alpha/beta hydrolase [Skermania piniformis]